MVAGFFGYIKLIYGRVWDFFKPVISFAPCGKYPAYPRWCVFLIYALKTHDKFD